MRGGKELRKTKRSRSSRRLRGRQTEGTKRSDRRRRRRQKRTKRRTTKRRRRGRRKTTLLAYLGFEGI